MVVIDDAARSYEPTGDSAHVAYGMAFSWTCECGATHPFVTTKYRAQRAAEAHEQECSGTATVEVV